MSGEMQELPSAPPPPQSAPPPAPAEGRPVATPPRSNARRAALTVLTALGALTSVASLVLLASTAQDAHLFLSLIHI